MKSTYLKFKKVFGSFIPPKETIIKWFRNNKPSWVRSSDAKDNQFVNYVEKGINEKKK